MRFPIRIMVIVVVFASALSAEESHDATSAINGLVATKLGEREAQMVVLVSRLEALPAEITAKRKALALYKTGRVREGQKKPVEIVNLPDGEQRAYFRFAKDKASEVRLATAQLATLESEHSIAIRDVVRMNNPLQITPEELLLALVKSVSALDIDQLRIGQAGVMLRTEARIAQIVDKNHALVLLASTRGAGAQTVMLATPTEGLADGTEISTKGIWKVEKTVKFTTALGTEKTVYLLRNRSDEFAANLEKTLAANSRQRASRIWSDAAMERFVVATVRAQDDATVTLARSDGSLFTLAKAKLSKEDVNYLDEILDE